MSKTLCAFPWKALYINSHEYVYPCCLAEENFYSHAKDSNGNSITSSSFGYFEKAFNSQYFKDMRLKMLAGDQVDSCQGCYRAEASGGGSYRTHSLEIHGKEIEVYKNLTSEDGSVQTKISMVDMKPGKLCNLHCLMCVPELSTGVEADYKKLGDRQATDISLVGSNELWKNLRDYAPELNRLNISGGEPLLNKELDSFMDYLIYKGFHSKIHMSVISNLSIINQSFLQKLSQFKEVSITLSMDGLGEVNDFIRYPIKFDKFIENIKELKSIFKDHTNFNLLLNSTCNIYNVHQIPEMIEFAKREIGGLYDHNIHPIVEPTILDICNLPNSYKEELIDKFTQLASTKGAPSIYDVIINRLNSSPNIENWKNEFLKFHRDYVSLRGFDILEQNDFTILD